MPDDGVLEAQNVVLRREVERLRAALEWYADQSNYRPRVDPDGRRYPPKAILDDGDRARAALSV